MLLKAENQDPRVQRTQQLLLQALMALVHEKDFRKITVGDITRHAGVNRATFYAHFEDKQALVNYSIQANFQEVLDNWLPSDPAFSSDNLRLLTLATCEFLEEFVGRCAPSAQQNHVPLLAQVQTHLYNVLLEWIQSTSDHKSLTATTPQVIAMATSWTIFGTAFEWAHGKRELSAAQLADQLLPLLARGLPSINNNPAST